GAARRLRDVWQGALPLGAALQRDLPHLRRRAARTVHVRVVPGRKRPEDLQVQGQRPDHRRVADLCAAREPGALHVPEAARRQAALFRRDPQGGRRLHRSAREVSRQRDQRRGALRQSGLAHPQRPSAAGTLSRQLRAAADARHRVERAQSRRAVGIHPRLRPASLADRQSRPRTSGRFRDPLLRRLRQADQALSSAYGQGARRDGGSRRAVRGAARLVQGALRGPVRPVRRPALRLLRGSFRLRRNRRADPPRAGGRIHGEGGMRRILALAAALLVPLAVHGAPAAPWDLYVAGRYAEAMKAGVAAKSATGYVVAARAALADATTRPVPCLACLRHAEDLARMATAADPRLADAHVYLAVAMGYEARAVGPVWARAHNYPGKAKSELDTALALDPRSPWALGALGGWNVEIVRTGGPTLADWLYGATVDKGLAAFAAAFRAAPDNLS